MKAFPISARKKRIMGKPLFAILAFLLFGAMQAAAQPVFNMMDTTVSVCKGKLYDSGGPNNIYKNNEDYTFTICTGAQIKLVFNQLANKFCLEPGVDTIRFFDGPNTASPKIGATYSGTTAPPTIVANSGCLTIHFKSDANVAYCGWEASWTSTVIPPVPPNFSISPLPQCNDTVLMLSLTGNYRCDSIRPKYFTVTGPVNPTVVTAAGVGCVSNMTTTIRLGLGQPLNQNCTYNVKFDMYVVDNCDSAWKFTKNATFLMGGCPYTVSVNLIGNDTICGGYCTQVRAVPSATCLSYSYSWSHSLPSNAGPHTVCPTATTVYTVTIQESGGNGAQVSMTQKITVISPKITALANDTVCQSDAPFNLLATPPGGSWKGLGITDTTLGTFDPDTSGAGVFYVKYKVSNMCTDSIRIVVLPMDAGNDDAACVNGPTFQVSGGIPSGGTWSGSVFITSGGQFNPSTGGVYTVIYTHPNGCSDTKKVFVDSLQVPLTTDSICKSIWYDTLKYLVSPPGGRFYGNGIVDSINGVINPTLAGAGLHFITYKLANGCAAVFKVYIKDINVQPASTACPYQGNFFLPPVTPAGGTWTGIGMVNGAGLYNPAAKGFFNHLDTLIYHAPNGCQDTLFMYSWNTIIYTDSLYYCESSDSLRIIYANLAHFPVSGVWSGNGIVLSGNYYFKPKIAGPGIHNINYQVNTCSDSIKMVVYPDKLANNTLTFCSTHPKFLVDSMVPASTRPVWSGIGITDTKKGLFDPTVSGNGTFTIIYKTPAGCSDTILITIYQYQKATITGLAAIQCFKDTNIALGLVPTGGTLTGNGIVGTSFNPSIAGMGTHWIKYTFGTGFCYTADSLQIQVYPQLTTSVTVSDDTICKGGGSVITITAAGGNPNVLYSYAWNYGLFPINQHTVSPTATTSYVVITSDGCSDPSYDTITIVVSPDYTVTFTTNPILCYGDPGFATAVINPSGNYAYSWATIPPQFTATATGLAGKSYMLHIKNVATGCTFDTLVKIPSYPVIKALFSPNPNLNCVPFDQNLITFIDLCNGADTGAWNINGTIVPYVAGQNPQFQFDNPGTYTITLTVTNQGGCMDSYTMTVCILEATEIFLPDIFSPNGDGQNDVLFVRGKGINQLRFILYDRWGEKIFETTDINIGWDGTFRGKPVDPAVYVYYLDVIMNTEKRIIQKGDVTLIR